MSFNYNPLPTAMPPMHHLIAPSTTTFLPKLPPNLLAPSAHHPHHQQSQQQQSQQQQQSHKPPDVHHFTQAPMDLENPNENPSSSNNNCDHHNDGCDNNNGTNNELVFNGILPQSFMMLPGVMMDPSLLGLQQFPTILNLPQTVTSQDGNGKVEAGNGNQVVKEVIHCASCMLIPPNPNAPAPTTRERPQGCRTVFVGGLPENITEAIIHEIFERCGEITTLRLSKKNFCHIRFVYEASVDSAIYLSGYRVKIGSNSDPTNTGRLHVDYAQARDDQYEYECKQRQLQREQRHREKDRFRSSSSPPSVPHYTEHEATSVAEKIKHDETFLKAVQTLVLWLERGDCSKKNANIFYSMIQSTNSHIRRLQGERTQHEDEFNEARNNYRQIMIKMNEQFNQIEKVFNAASHKKVWDHFTKAQRKNIDQWCKQATDIRGLQIDDFADNNDDEMEMSDDESLGKANKRIKLDKSKKKDDRSLRSLSHDIVDLSKTEHKIDSELKSKQIKVLQETIRNLQRRLLETNTKEKQNEAKITELEESVRESNVKELLLRTKIANARSTSQSVDDCSETSSIIEKSQLGAEVCGSKEAQVISLATAFLVIHPNGATIDAIHNYTHDFAIGVNEGELIDVLVKHEKIFRLDDGRWHYYGFNLMRP